MADNAQGRLLVASPHLPDPNFYRTVVLMIDHSHDGALGLVLNRVSDTSLRTVWESVVGSECGTQQHLFVGGPVDGPLMAPLVEVPAVDSAHPSGYGGLFNNSVPDTGTTDATFDNYRSSIRTDVDKDGMDDQWEVDNFGDLFWFGEEDTDGDGQTNLEEFVGGSDPNDWSSRSGITSLERVSDDVVVTFPVASGRTYSLEASLDLQMWEPQPVAVFSENGGIGTFTMPAGGLPSFYVRVMATVDD